MRASARQARDRAPLDRLRVSAAGAASAPSRPRELLLAALAGCLLAVVMHWPLVLHLGETIPKDLGDPLPQSWQVAWGGHALAHQPLDFFQSNQFWPLDDTLAFSDALIGYAPAGLIGSGPEAAATRYDLLFLFAYALAFAGAYLLARELGLGPAGAAVAGAALRVRALPARAGRPPARDLERRHPARARARRCAATACAARAGCSPGSRSPPGSSRSGRPSGCRSPICWRCSELIAAVVWIAPRAPGARPRGSSSRPWPARRCCLGRRGLIALPYLRVADEHPDAERPPSTVEAYSDSPQVFAVAPGENLIWGGATSAMRDELQNPQEKTLFPGLVILGAGDRRRWSRARSPRGSDRPRRRRRRGSASSRSASRTGGLPVAVPDRLRAASRAGTGSAPPGRLFTFATLGLALLAGAGASPRWRGAAAPGAATRGAVGGGRRRGARRSRSRSRAAGCRSTRPTARRSPGSAGARPTSRRSRRRSCTCPPQLADRQPPLPAVVDRRLPRARQRPLEHRAGVHTQA